MNDPGVSDPGMRDPGGWATLYDPHPARRFILRAARYLGLVPGYPEPDDDLDIDLAADEIAVEESGIGVIPLYRDEDHPPIERG